MSETYDCIVIGVGGFGSGAFYHLAKRGVKVLGIEQFGIGHDRGSSHGETRIIRKAYFEHPNYVPLAVRAYDLWRELAAESGETLMRLSGIVLVGPREGEAVGGAKLSARQHGLVLEELPPAEAKSRFPALHFPAELAVVHEPDAGYVFVEKCVRAHIHQAQRYGGILRVDETVQSWSSNGRTVTVQTDKGSYEAARLIVTAGPWSARLLREIRVPLRVLRKPVFWHPIDAGYAESIADLPGFLYELPQGVFYGLPGAEGSSIKVAEHSGGQPIDDPNAADRNVSAEDQQKIEAFLKGHIPAAGVPFQKHSICFYTMTPDGHFLIDRHPRFDNVVFGAGFSGHGFKFTGVLGQALADLAIGGTTPLPVEFLSLARASLSPQM